MVAGRFKVLSAMVAVMVMVITALAFAQEKPKIAVYVKGGMGDEVKAAFRNELLFALAKSERYSAVDDNDVFVAAVKKEMERHDGVSDMNYMQIGKAGEHVNADFVCVASVSPVLGGYQVFARVIDVKNEAVAEMGRGAGAIASVADVAKIAGEIVESMFGVSGKAAPQVQAAVQEQQGLAVTPAAAETPAARPRGPIKAAVYVTGVPDLVGKTLNSAISSALIKSKVYAGIESIDVSGAPGVPALADAGRNAGVSYIFAINVAGQISVAIIDVAGTVELAKISIDGKITAINAAAIAKKIVDFILTSGPKPDSGMQAAGETAPVYNSYFSHYIYPLKTKSDSDGKPRILQNRISLEAGIGGTYGSSRYSYGKTVSPDSAVRWSGPGGGFSMYYGVDLKYVEMYGDVSLLFNDDHEDYGIAGTGLIGFFAKYPFVFNAVPVKVTPILGVGGITTSDIDDIWGFIFGGRIDVGISKTVYLRSEYLYDLGVGKEYKGGSGMSLKAGGGLEIAIMGKFGFWRTELMYNWLSMYNPEYTRRKYGKDEHRVDGRSAIHYVDIRTGIGCRW